MVKKKYLIRIREYHDGVLYNQFTRMSHWFINKDRAIKFTKKQCNLNDYIDIYGHKVAFVINKKDVVIKCRQQFEKKGEHYGTH